MMLSIKEYESKIETMVEGVELMHDGKIKATWKSIIIKELASGKKKINDEFIFSTAYYTINGEAHYLSVLVDTVTGQVYKYRGDVLKITVANENLYVLNEPMFVLGQMNYEAMSKHFTMSEGHHGKRINYPKIEVSGRWKTGVSMKLYSHVIVACLTKCELKVMLTTEPFRLYEVHHKERVQHCEFPNRAENLEVLTIEEHKAQHRKRA